VSPPAKKQIRTAAVLWGVLVCVAAPGPARAQGAEARNRAQRKAAEGAAMADRGEHVEAVRLFKEAYQLYENPGYLYNLGIAYQALGDDVQALHEFEHFLDAARKVPPEFIADAVSQTRELKKRIATVEVRCTQDGAQVAIDRREVGSTPLRPVRLLAGTHRVEVTKPGFVPFGEELAVKHGEEARVEALLRPVPVTAPTLAEPLREPPAPAEQAEPGAFDVGAAVAVHQWLAGTARKVGASLAPRLDAGYALTSAGPFTLRAGLAAGVSFLTEDDGSRVTFVSVLAVPGGRLSLSRSLYASFDAAVGLLLISGLHPGSVLLSDDARDVTGVLPSFEVRPALGLGWELRPGVAVVLEGGLVWDSRPTAFFREGALVRLEIGAGIRWTP
jgi:hypothetical protein